MFSKFVLYAGRIGWAIILLAIFAVILMALVNSAAR
jgi:diacylglycerol kinase